MGWSNEMEDKTNKTTDLSSKILIAIIVCILLIIVLISILLINLQQESFSISVDNKAVTTVTKDTLFTEIDNTTYINIEEFAGLVGYEYHQGEYKAFTIEKDKCYVQGEKETASFYLNDNKVCKLPVNELTEEYQEYTVEKTVKSLDDKMYASLEAISKAFNVVIDEGSNYLYIYTLDYLVETYDAKVKEWGYTSIAEQSFENKKAILYGYLIVQKEGGLYKIIDIDNTKEIVSDKYNEIEFVENTQEFFVTNSLGQVGIINLDGTTKIEPIYNSISVLDKQSDLYLIQKSNKYGVVKSGNITIVFPEYDSIGVDTKGTGSYQYLLLDTLIPVRKNNKWGAFDKEGNLVYKVEYDGIGCYTTSVDVDNTKKAVNSVIAIERCNGVVVKKSDKYGLLDIKGKELVPAAVSAIYQLENVEDEDSKYYMLYNGKEINIIERLIEVNLIEKTPKLEDNSTITNNTTVNNNTVTNNINNTTNNSIENTVTTSANVSAKNNTITQNINETTTLNNNVENKAVVVE